MSRNVIFLDFDGVLRPMMPYRKTRTKERNLSSVLSERYHDPAYEEIDESMLRNIYYDFSGEACYCIKLLCQIPHTDIVLSTSWRGFYELSTMQKLLELHQIGRYVVDKTPIHFNNRAAEIQEYLDQHPEIAHFIIVDDMDLSTYFPDQMLLCKDHLQLTQYAKGYEILTGHPLTFF